MHALIPGCAGPNAWDHWPMHGQCIGPLLRQPERDMMPRLLVQGGAALVLLAICSQHCSVPSSRRAAAGAILAVQKPTITSYP